MGNFACSEKFCSLKQSFTESIHLLFFLFLLVGDIIHKVIKICTFQIKLAIN